MTTVTFTANCPTCGGDAEWTQRPETVMRCDSNSDITITTITCKNCDKAAA